MILIHGGILDGRLLLWGETPPDAGRAPDRPRRRRPKTARPQALPYDAGAEALCGALRDTVFGLKPDPQAAETVFAWLPTVYGGGPVASSPVIAEPPEPGVEIDLAPWTVTALSLSPDQAVMVLGASVGRPTLAPSVLVGPSLAFRSTVLRFAGALVVRQQFLPGVAEADDRFRARWEPVIAGADASTLSRLAGAMPTVARALARESTAAPAVPALPLVSTLLGIFCDHLVRSSVHAPTPTGLARSTKPAAFDSLHDQWLHALQSEDGEMPGGAADLRAFAAQVREWRRPLSLSLAAPFRLSFRLEEPLDPTEDYPGGNGATGDAGSWHVRYLLQAADDPSLLVPAESAWAKRGRTASLLKHEGFEPREYLLSALGQASKISPTIEASLKTAAPAGYDLDTSGAEEFLQEKAWLLEQAGFGVLLPAWWTRKGTKLHLTSRANVKTPKMQGGGGLTLDSLVKFDWEVALGDERLSLAELEELARCKTSLVRVRGQWVQLNAREIEAALEFWKKKGTGEATARDIVRLALGAEAAPGGMEFTGVNATGWMADLLAKMEGRAALEETPLPEEFRGTLRPYQRRGYSWLDFLTQWGLGACLADDMGLGKTVQVLAFVRRQWEAGDRRPTLVVCPTSVVGNWQKEAQRFTPDLPVMVHHGLTRTKGPAFRRRAEEYGLVLSSFALLHRDFDILKEADWAAVILDEAQNIKNPETKQARAARGLPAARRIALTGTPVENHVGDLWSIMEFLNPGFLGNQTAFRRDFFVPIQANRDPEAADRLKRLTGPFVLRRLKTDKAIIADLPEKMEMKVFCTLTREQASLYAAVVREAEEALDESEGIQRRGVILGTLSRLKQVCNHPAQFLGDNSAIPGRSGKLARLTEMLEEALSAGDKALIFSQFAEMGEILRRHLQETFGREVLFLHGGVPKAQRDRMVERFQADGAGPPLFVLSLKAGGTGLNLTAANHVFHFDRWWNPAVENQATDRAFRIGQRKNVQVHKFVCAGTLEDKIDEMIENKRQVAANVVGTGEGWLTELSTTELKALFALRQDAVAE